MDGFTVSHYLNPVIGVSEAFRPCAVTDLKKRTAETASSTPACLSQLDCAGGRQLAPSSHMSSTGRSATVSPSLCRPVGFVCCLIPVRMYSNKERFFTCISATPTGSQGTGCHRRCRPWWLWAGTVGGLGSTSGLDLAAALQHPRLHV